MGPAARAARRLHCRTFHGPPKVAAFSAHQTFYFQRSLCQPSSSAKGEHILAALPSSSAARLDACWACTVHRHCRGGKPRFFPQRMPHPPLPPLPPSAAACQPLAFLLAPKLQVY